MLIIYKNPSASTIRKPNIIKKSAFTGGKDNYPDPLKLLK